MNTADLSDEALIARLTERDSEAFAALYDRHSRLAFGLAYRMLNDASAAEDVVQEAFLSLWRQAETFQQSRSSARTWLLSIVHHRAVDRLRRRDSHEIADTAAMEQLADREDPQSDVEAEVSQSLEAVEIRKALQDLPAEQRQAIELAYFSGLSHSEIARKLSIPPGTVKGRIRIGLQKLRVFLDGAHLVGNPHDA